MGANEHDVHDGTRATVATPSTASAEPARASSVRDAARHDGVFWRRLAYAGTVHAPTWWRRYSPPWFGALAWALVADRRRACVEHWRELGLVDTEIAAELGALRTYLAFAHSLTDGLEIAAKGLDAYSVETPSPSPMVLALAMGRGAVVVTAHTGSWEVMGNMLGNNHHIGVTMAMAPEENASAREFADAVRQKYPKVEVAYVGRGPTDALALVAAIRAKRVVALQLDRTPPGMATISAPFFGKMRAFPLGPFLLAQATGAPLVAAFTRRLGFRRYFVDMPAGIVEIPRGRRDDARMAPYVARVAAGFEQFVRRTPEQWYHFDRSSR